MRSLILGALHNRVASNLLAVLLILSGMIALQILNVRIFPQFELNSIVISVPYPGATPNEIETSVIKPVEERLEGFWADLFERCPARIPRQVIGAGFGR